MTDRPLRSFSITERRILDAKERFDEMLREHPNLPPEERLAHWREFLDLNDADLKALSWLRLAGLEKEMDDAL